ncbi:MAG TPA: hypothetical protein VN029_13755 [Sphingomonas sp.]|nr:hypothetical protein [Sphingomonas sp.]
MPADLIAFEAAKLALQFGGALLIARLAVVWALRRYKAEKSWERRLAAYVDVVTAIGEMLHVVGRWMSDVEDDRNPTEEWNKAQRERYQAARRRLDEGAAAASLILPQETTATLTQLRKELEASPRGGDYYLALDHDYGNLTTALKSVVAQGRATLGPEITK